MNPSLKPLPPLFLNGAGRVIDPFWLAGLMAALGAAACLFSIPETAMAVSLILLYTLVTAAQPVNGVVFLFLMAPCFLSAAYRPYFYLLDVFVVVSIVCAAAHTLIKKPPFAFPLLFPVSLFVAVAALSLPLDFRELFLELWARPPGFLFELWVVGYQVSQVYYFRVLFDVATAALVFSIAFHFWPKDGERLAWKTLDAFIGVAAIVSLIGILIYYVDPARPERYLGMMLRHQKEGIAAFAWSPAFLAQYLAMALFATAGMIFFSPAHWLKRALYVAAAALFVFVTAHTGQRSGLLALCALVMILLAVYLRRAVRPGLRVLLYLALPVAMALVVVGLDWLVFGGVFWKLLHHFLDEDRIELWKAAAGMAKDYPVLGVGLGRYTYFFPDYYTYVGEVYNREEFTTWFGRARINAHSFYLHLLAERGILGALSLAALLLSVGWGAAQAFKSGIAAERKGLIGAFLMILAAWLFHGVFNHLGQLRSFELMFWIALAGAVALGRPFFDTPAPGRRTVAVVCAVLAAAFAHQAALAYSRPISEDYALNFYDPERQPDGGYARWTNKRAVRQYTVKGASLALHISAPIPGVEKNPHHLNITYGGNSVEEIAVVNEWRNVILPMDRAKGERILVWFEVDRTYNPRKAGTGGDTRDLGVMVKEPVWLDK